MRRRYSRQRNGESHALGNSTRDESSGTGSSPFSTKAGEPSEKAKTCTGIDRRPAEDRITSLHERSFFQFPANKFIVAIIGILACIIGFRKSYGTPWRPQQVIGKSMDAENHGFHNKPRVLKINEKLTKIPETDFFGVFLGRDRAVKREIHISKAELDARRISMLDSEDNPEFKKKAEPMYTDDPPCQPQYFWQTRHLPACNLLHETDVTDMIATYEIPSNNGEERGIEKFKYLASGGYRDVFMIRDQDSSWDRLALKTLKLSRNFTENHYDRHRRDAMVAERMTSVSTSVDIYAYCANSAIYQFAKGGNLKEAILKSIDSKDEKPRTWNSNQMLHIATDVATAVADFHNVDMEGRASIAHTDISTDQFISIEGHNSFKINDFNRARFIRWNNVNNTACPFYVKSNKGKNRSPEEYKYEAETEKVDVYSMGNVIYFITTGETPFLRLSKKATKKAVIRGTRPDFGSLGNSTDRNIQALITAAHMCWIHDPVERATAREVQLFLESNLP